MTLPAARPPLPAHPAVQPRLPLLPAQPCPSLCLSCHRITRSLLAKRTLAPGRASAKPGQFYESLSPAPLICSPHLGVAAVPAGLAETLAVLG